MMGEEKKASQKMTNIDQEENKKVVIDHHKSEHTMGMQKSKYI